MGIASRTIKFHKMLMRQGFADEEAALLIDYIRSDTRKAARTIELYEILQKHDYSKQDAVVILTALAGDEE